MTALTTNSMGTERISRLLLKTGIPLMLSLLINSLYNFVDSVFVSRIAEDALTALSLSAPVQVFVSALGLGNAVGLNAAISKALGEKNPEQVKKTASAAIFLAVCAWLLISAACLLGVRQYFEWQSGGNTFGIHSRGCGDASFDTLYTIGKKMAQMGSEGKLLGDALRDSIRAVEEYLIDEMALETCFEGYRFGDLMRISQHRGADIGGDFENDFLARRVATRETAVMNDKIDYYRDMDMELYNKLLGADSKKLNKAWFLVLPDEK